MAQAAWLKSGIEIALASLVLWLVLWRLERQRGVFPCWRCVICAAALYALTFGIMTIVSLLDISQHTVGFMPLAYLVATLTMLIAWFCLGLWIVRLTLGMRQGNTVVIVLYVAATALVEGIYRISL